MNLYPLINGSYGETDSWIQDKDKVGPVAESFCLPRKDGDGHMPLHTA